jgi:hypothetical protein
MCRSIVPLRGEEPALPEEVQAAARQFIRKVSGYRAPSKAHEEAFELAVREVAEATQRLLDQLPAGRGPAMARSRIVAREKAARAG